MKPHMQAECKDTLANQKLEKRNKLNNNNNNHGAAQGEVICVDWQSSWILHWYIKLIKRHLMPPVFSAVAEKSC